jgi:hypothetical protein
VRAARDTGLRNPVVYGGGIRFAAAPVIVEERLSALNAGDDLATAPVENDVEGQRKI